MGEMIRIYHYNEGAQAWVEIDRKLGLIHIVQIISPLKHSVTFLPDELPALIRALHQAQELLNKPAKLCDGGESGLVIFISNDGRVELRKGQDVLELDLTEAITVWSSLNDLMARLVLTRIRPELSEVI